MTDLDKLVEEIKSCKLEIKDANKFKEAYNQGIEVAAGIVELWWKHEQSLMDE